MWHLHDQITGGHHYQRMEELLDLIFACLQQRIRFMIEYAVYVLPLAA